LLESTRTDAEVFAAPDQEALASRYRLEGERGEGGQRGAAERSVIERKMSA